ncbi:MAG: helix-turn-helix domain-containing protein [Clostridia bacterium]|nr:helix-turn-helix domain-containing protein [Clostridia bacterium]
MKVYKYENCIGNGRRIGICRKLQLTPERLHCHEFIEIVYVLSGRAVQKVDNASYDVERGDVIFINYGSCHAFEPTESFEYVNVYFMPELLSDSIITPENALALLSLTSFDEMRKDKNGGKLSFFGEERREVEFILSAMMREYTSDLPSAEAVIESYLAILFTKMMRRTALSEVEPARDFWDELCDYIDKNLHEELTLSSLAKKSFYNPSYFSRIFKQKYGVSLSDHIRRRRIEHAMALLTDSNLSVDEIIARTGYTDRSAFYHAFSKVTGMAPAEYRAGQKVK